ncbi:MAG: hypothetical protein P8Q14_10640 [Vicingaceae bacterium]|nr:hypothetical protein [Vicingaceae bacterium]
MLNKTEKKVESVEIVTINDLRDFDYSGQPLSHQQRLALKNFERYRIHELNQQLSEKDFHNRYAQIQVMANLHPFKEFLKEEYFV